MKNTKKVTRKILCHGTYEKNNTTKEDSMKLKLGIAFTFPIAIEDKDGNRTYYENSNGYWYRNYVFEKFTLIVPPRNALSEALGNDPPFQWRAIKNVV
jgi:hypothetical protein